MLDFEVNGLADEAQTVAVLHALTTFLREEERLEQHEVGVGRSVENGRHRISGETDHPIAIARMAVWRPHFETSVRDRVHAIAPAAVATVNWRYPDGD